MGSTENAAKVKESKEAHISIKHSHSTIAHDHTQNWRYFIFLPFNVQWKYLVVCTTILNFGMNAMDFIFIITDTYLHTVLYYIFEAIYLVDTLALLFHRRMTHFRKRGYHQPTSVFMLSISIISLFPYFEVYYLLNVYTWNYVPPSDFTRIKVVLRFISVYVYFINKKDDVGVNQIMICICNHILRLLFVITFLSCVWYKMGCYKCGYDDWTIYLNDFHFSANNSVHWMIICGHVIGNLIAHNWRGSIDGESYNERIFVAIVMFFGYLLHVMILMGELIGAYIQEHWHHYEFTSKLRKIDYLLDDWHIDKEVKRKTIEYYKVFWERRLAMRDMPESFQLLPLSMRKDVTVDIFWQALRHSHIFVGTDIAFKRSIGMVMKSEFLLPGDFLFKVGQLKTKMVYVVSGVVQVLTEEDNESPILSFSSGTLLGEIACLRATTSQANVKCATYTELHTLDMVDLYKILNNDREMSVALLNSLKARISNAQTISKEVAFIRRILIYDMHNTSIKRLKHQWRVISCLHTLKKRNDATLWKKLDKTFTSQFMDLIVLSEEVELKVQAVCLTSHCPLIMHPDTSFRNFCEYLTVISVCLYFFIVPYLTIFRIEALKHFSVLLFILNLFYILDVYIQLTTAIKVGRTIISNYKEIMQYRFKQISFIVDMIAAIPVSLLLFLFNNNLLMLFYLPRVIKIYKLFMFLNQKQRNLRTNTIYVQFFKYAMLSAIFLYFCVCVLYSCACYSGICNGKSWYILNKHINQFKLNDSFSMSFYYTISIFLSNGLSRNVSYSIIDIIITTLIGYIGYFFWTFAFADLIASLVLHVKKTYAHQDELSVMKGILKHRLITGKLYSRCVMILDFNWKYNEGAEIQGQRGIFNDASEKIKTEIVNERIASCLEAIPLFSRFSSELIKCISLHMKVTIIPAETQLIEIGTNVVILYIILRGYCTMQSSLPGDKERNKAIILKRGDILLPLELLHKLTAVASIRTSTAVEVMHMPCDTLEDILRSHRGEYHYIQKVLEHHIELYNNILQKKSCRLPELKSFAPALGKIESFEYEVITNKKNNAKVRDEYVDPFRDLHQWGCVRYFMLRRTINPKGTFFITWEIFRIAVIFADVLCSMLILSIFIKYQKGTDYLTICSHVVATIDIYIRMHCEYYNHRGILVTHPLYTAKYYLQHAFLIDLIIALPITITSVAKMFGPSYETHAKGVMRLLTRPIQLYRPFMALSYFEGKLHWSKGSILMKIKYSMIIFAIIGIFANFLIIHSCKFDNAVMNCSGSSWLSTSPLKEQSREPYIVFLESVYFTIAIYTHTICGTFAATSIGEIKLFIIMAFFLHLMRYIVLSTFASCTIGGNFNLSIYQARVKQFLKFAKEVNLDKRLIKEIVWHNEYVWKETQGTSIMEVGSKLSLYLRFKFVCFLYENTLRSTCLFASLSSHSLRRLALHFEELHFKKDADIIRCNDVQTKLFIVYRGQVEVAVANSAITSLGVGGVFGCFSRQGVLRQTLDITAKMHTIILAIDSREFHRVMSPWDNDQAREIMKDVKLLKLEYLEPFVCSWDLGGTTIKPKRKLLFVYYWVILQVNKIINQESYWFNLWEYMIYVHISVITSILILGNLCLSVVQESNVAMFYFIQTIDLLYCIKIFLGFTLQHVDVNTGIIIREPKRVFIVYLKSAFIFDVFTCMPFNVILKTWTKSYSKLGTLNRACRYFYMVEYYDKCRAQLNIKKHLRWTYLIYKALFQLQLMTNVWILCACFNGYCQYVNYKGDTTYANSTVESVVIAYSYIVSVFTATGLSHVKPVTLLQMFIAMIMNWCIPYVMVSTASGFATLVIIENSIMNDYKYGIQRLSNYLKGRNLSPMIFNNVWAYLLQLWSIQRGEWMPMLIYNAPAYLRQDIMRNLYMNHLENHFLFAKTHKDFLRQLVVHFERCIYFPGNYIVNKGDLDNAMYFIHKGEVGAYEKEGSNEVQLFMLSMNMSFGEIQGIQHIPYNLSYKALSIVEVLTLRKNSWEYLLKWFPATDEELNLRCKELGFSVEAQYLWKL